MGTPAADLNLKESKPEAELKQSFTLNRTSKNGLLAQIYHNARGQNCTEKQNRFIYATFSDKGERLAIIDHSGNIFVFDLAEELFWELPNFGMCSLIIYNAYKTDEILIGQNDGTIYIVNSESGNITGCLKGHTQPLRQVSFAQGLPYCISTTYAKAIVWDLRSNSQLHQLNLQTKVSIKMVMFLPTTNNILGCFKDDTIHIWKFKTLECVKQIVPEELKIHRIKSIAITRDGRAMVLANKSGTLAVVSLDTGDVQKIISFPEVCSGVKYIAFLPQLFDGGANKILTVLSSVTVHMIDIESSTLLNTVVQPQGRINSVVCSPHGKYLACIIQSGEVNIYNSAQLLVREEQKLTVSKFKTQRRVYKKQYEKQLAKVHDQMNQVLDKDRLMPLLKQYGEYPTNNRSLIWKTILKLPGNQTAYATLVDKGTHPAYASLDQKYPLKSYSLLKSLRRLLSCLAHWCPLFSQVMHLPVFVLPFLKVFKYDQHVCFEVVAAILVNWCQFWFEYFPYPPVNVLTMIENVLEEHDPKLAVHLSQYQISSHIYAWPLLETAFSEVLSRKDWLQFWDHVLSNHPMFLLFAVAAFNIAARTSLISMQNKTDFENFFSKEALNTKVLIKKTYQLMSNTSDEYHPKQYIKPYQGLLKGHTYQEFTQYPKNLLDNQIDELYEIQKENAKLIQEQKELLQKKMEIEAAKQEQKQAKINEARLLELEDLYRNTLRDEESRIAEHRRKITVLRHELHRQEYHLIEEAKNKMLNSKTAEKKKELERLLSDIDHKRVQDELEIQAIEQETRSHHLQLLKKKKQLEMQLEMEVRHPDPQHMALRKQQQILSEQLKKLREEASKGHCHRQMELTTYIAVVDDLLQKVELELAREMAERHSGTERRKQNQEVLQLEKETKVLEKDVEILLEELMSHRENELSRKTYKLQQKGHHALSSSSNTHYISRNEYSSSYDPIQAALDLRRKIIMKKIHSGI